MSTEGKSLHLNEVVECLIQQEQSLAAHPKPPQNINNIYESTKNLLGELDDHVSRCKKYNQAKIHRKYQIVIHDLTQQNIILRAKVKQELHARPSSQKYVSDLIDKMIELRSANQQLQKENDYLSNLVRRFEERGQVVVEKRNAKNEQNPESSQATSRRQWEKVALKEAASKFLVKKKFQTLNQHVQQSSNFQKFILFNKNKIQKWYLLDFFQRIDKWTSHLKDVRFLDRSRLIGKIEDSLEKNESSPPSDKLLPAFSTLQRPTLNRTLIENTLERKAQLNSKLKSKNIQSVSFRLRSVYQSQKKMEATLQ